MLARCSFLAAVVPLLACGEPAEPTRFVAAVSDDEGGLSIGLTVHGDLIAAYACCDGRAGEQRQVTPLGPMELVDGHLPVVVELERGAYTLLVAPVELPMVGEG